MEWEERREREKVGNRGTREEARGEGWIRRGEWEGNRGKEEEERRKRREERERE